MKTSLLRIGILASLALLSAGAAHATLLVGWYDFEGTSSTTSGSTADETPDYAAAGFSGLVTKDGQFSVGAGGSTGDYGNSGIPAGPGNDGYARVYQNSQLTFSMTNGSGSAVQLDKLYFDAANTNTFTVKYQITGQPTPTTLGTGTGTTPSYKDFAFNLLSLPLLSVGQTISFIFTSPAGTRIDNVGITGLSAIPEPASLIALGCVLGSGLMIRRRQCLPTA